MHCVAPKRESRCAGSVARAVLQKKTLVLALIKKQKRNRNKAIPTVFQGCKVSLLGLFFLSIWPNLSSVESEHILVAMAACPPACCPPVCPTRPGLSGLAPSSAWVKKCKIKISYLVTLPFLSLSFTAPWVMVGMFWIFWKTEAPVGLIAALKSYFNWTSFEITIIN